MIKKLFGLIFVLIGGIIVIASNFFPLYIPDIERSIIFFIEAIFVIIGLLLILVEE